jgi:hypothetical protein
MGNGRGDSIGLYFNNELLTCFQYKRTQNNHYELSRFSHKLGYNIVGGFSRLLKFFETEIRPDTFTTFVDMRYGGGSYLTSFGFEKKSCEASFDWTNGQVRHNRSKFLSNIGYDYGFYKIWDCGQAKWKKVYKLA